MTHRVMMMIIGSLYMLYLLGIEWAAAVIGWRSIRKTWPSGYRWLVVLATISVVVETVTLAGELVRISPGPVYNFQALVETGMLLYIQYLLAIRRRSAVVIMASLILLVMGTIVFFIVWPVFDQVHIKYLVFNMFVQLIGICVALIDIVQGSMEKLLSRQPAFWMNIGLLFYCSIYLVGHIWGMYSRESASGYVLWFSLVGNTFMYFGFIACFRTLRKEDKKNGLIK